MGRGDKKSKKGKIWRGSYGVNRNRKKIKAAMKRSASAKPAASAEEKPKARKTVKKKESAE